MCYLRDLFEIKELYKNRKNEEDLYFVLKLLLIRMDFICAQTDSDTIILSDEKQKTYEDEFNDCYNYRAQIIGENFKLETLKKVIEKYETHPEKLNENFLSFIDQLGIDELFELRKSYLTQLVYEVDDNKLIKDIENEIEQIEDYLMKRLNEYPEKINNSVCSEDENLLIRKYIDYLIEKEIIDKNTREPLYETNVCNSYSDIVEALTAGFPELKITRQFLRSLKIVNPKTHKLYSEYTFAGIVTEYSDDEERKIKHTQKKYR